MTQLTHDVAEAQEAGNEAYALAEEQGKSFVECADAYRKAYCEVRDRQEAQQAAPALDADTQQLIGTTRRIWNETQAEAY